MAERVYKVAQRPGTPMWFGIGPEGQTVFGLPGNPVATLICLIRYVIPAMSTATGTAREPPQTVILGQPVKFNKGVTYFLPVSVHDDERGRGAAILALRTVRAIPRPGGLEWIRRTSARRRTSA